jgi:D-3-phosphoglycerate dehydrogenase
MAISNDISGHVDRPKVLVAEKVSPDGLELLKETLNVHEKRGLSSVELLQIISEYSALVVRSETKVTEELLAAGTSLKVVARAGVGVDNVNVEAATQHGIIVVNSPSGNIGAAAEHTIALLMATARHVPAGCASLKSGGWERSKLVGVEVNNKTLGLIGLGKVGLRVARLANGLGMRVMAMDPYASQTIATTNSVTLVPDLATLLPQLDFLSVHTPLIASTTNLISKNELKLLKPTARVLNVARGGVINEEALLEALEAGALAGAGLDVFTSEPPQPDSSAFKLVSHPRVVCTPHLGASTVEAQNSVSLDVCTQLVSILAGNPPSTAVNAPLILPEEYKKLQPFVQLVEQIGSLYTQHFTSRQRPQQCHFDLTYEGALADVSTTRPLFAALVKGLIGPVLDGKGRSVNIVNAPLIAKERGIIINETHVRSLPSESVSYSSLVTLRARKDSAEPTGPDEQMIQGFATPTSATITRLGRFATSFHPEGHLLICHNYDTPGKIGLVGGILGMEGVNVGFMSVAPVDKGNGIGGGNEALMILKVDKEVGQETLERMRKEDGILDVSVVML